MRYLVAVLTVVTMAKSTLAADPSAPDPVARFHQELTAITPGSGQFPPTALAAFAIAKYEVPQNLYQQVMGGSPSRWKGPRNSVEMLDHAEAVRFCERLTEVLRQRQLIQAEETVRLPTQAEWEYCCRAGSKSAYCFGDDPKRLGEFAWHHGNAAGNDPPVGAKKPNNWGLYDMHGYVWEWTADQQGDRRMVVGGAWTSSPAECRSDSRRWVAATLKAPDVGLRCVVAKADK